MTTRLRLTKRIIKFVVVNIFVPYPVPNIAKSEANTEAHVESASSNTNFVEFARFGQLVLMSH